MNFSFKSFFSAKKEESPQEVQQPTAQRIYNEYIPVRYHGEKNPGELGVIKEYQIDHAALRARSWATFLDSDLAAPVINKYARWVIGSGLKVQCRPVMDIINSAGVDLDESKFKKTVESRFRLFCDSKMSVWNKEQTLNQYSFEGFKNTIVGGDILVSLLVDKTGRFNIQHVDAAHVQTPPLNSKEYKQAEARGNKITCGIEKKKGLHVAYHINTGDGFKRLKAWHDNGMRITYLVFGNRHRIDTDRGMPLMSSGLEAITKLDRYREAAIGGAEQRAKNPFSIEHDVDGSGKNPLVENVRTSVNLNSKIPGAADNAEAGESAAAKIAATVPNEVFNLPPGAKLKTIDSTMEMNFDSFFLLNYQVFCAALEIPLQIALSKVDSNYGAGRGITMEWQKTFKDRRKNFATDYFQPIYEFWLMLEDGKGSISAPKLAVARLTDSYLYSAYMNTEFFGANAPHSDPLKEAKAIRERLGEKGAGMPLITGEQATEELSGGDFDENMQSVSEEIELMEKLMPTPEPIEVEEKEPKKVKKSQKK